MASSSCSTPIRINFHHGGVFEANPINYEFDMVSKLDNVDIYAMDYPAFVTYLETISHAMSNALYFVVPGLDLKNGLRRKSNDGEGSSGGITYDSPYYLHPSDYPKQLHVNEVLTDNNFADWSQEMTNFLFAKNKIEIVDGTIKKPEKGSKDYMPWMRVDTMIKGWLTTAIEKNIRNSIKYAGTASEIWSDLNEWFGKESSPRAYELKQKITSTQQAGDTDERQRAVSSENAKPLDSAAFKAFQRKIAPYASNKERTGTKIVKDGTEYCTECRKEGHRREGCFKIIGYPDWWPEKKGDKSRGKVAYVETEVSPIPGLSNNDYQTFLKHFSRI
nr:hypothetical protein [Tanacetum cinerariifolium]